MRSRQRKRGNEESKARKREVREEKGKKRVMKEAEQLGGRREGMIRI